MTYGKRFFGEFTDRYNRTVLVEIYKKGYDGIADEMTFTGDPLSANHPGDDNDILNPIFGKELSINILSMTDFQYIELHSSDARGYKVKVFIDSDLDFEGWILPDLFTEPYVAPPYPVSVSARCGLAELKEIPCPDELQRVSFSTTEPTSPNNSSNFVSLLTLIYRGLQRVSDISDVSENINIYPAFDFEELSPLNEVGIYLSEYKDKSWYDAIADVLLALHCRLYQESGRWKIKRIWENGTIERKYTFINEGDKTWLSSLDYSSVSDSVYQIGKPVNRNILADSAQLDVLPALKNYAIENTFTINNHIFKNGNFIDTELSLGGFRSATNPTYRTYRPVKNWNVIDTDLVFYDLYKVREIYESVNGNLTYDAQQQLNNLSKTSKQNTLRQVTINETTKGMFMPGFSILLFDNAPPVYLNEINEIKSDVVQLDNGTFTTDEGITAKQSLKINIKVAAIGSADLGVISIKIRQVVSGLTLKVNDEGQNEWVSEDFYNNFDIETSKLDNPNFNEIEIITDYLENENELIELYIKNTSPLNSLLFESIDSILIESLIVEEINIPYAYTNKIVNDFKINENNVKVGETIELISGDLPPVPNNALIWGGGFRFNTGSYPPTEKWHLRGETTELPLHQLNAIQYSSLKLIPQFKLSLSILSSDLVFSSKIVDYQILPKVYICNAFNYNYRNCIGEGTYIEIGVWDGANWILEDGTWNDQGIWIDGETWNDEDPTP